MDLSYLILAGKSAASLLVNKLLFSRVTVGIEKLGAFLAMEDSLPMYRVSSFVYWPGAGQFNSSNLKICN